MTLKRRIRTLKKTGFALMLAAALAVPVAAPAAPTKTDTKAASKECHDLIDATVSKENFSSLTGFDTFGQCVSEKAHEEAQERRGARRAAREACTGLKGVARRDCVSAKAEKVKARKDAKDQARIDAAATCASEQEDAATFAENYGTKKNALRKCVNSKT
jgi:hypothetical protein